MALFYRFDGRDVRALFKPIYTVMDLVFVPAGVLAALLYNAHHARHVRAVHGTDGGVRAEPSTASAARSRPRTRSAAPSRACSRRAARCTARGASRSSATALLDELRPLLRFDDFYLVVVDREQASLDFRVHEQRGERQPRRPPAAGRRPVRLGR